MSGMRKCGYCRDLGHMSRVCHRRLGQIEAVRRHIGRQRLAIGEALPLNGYGVGAIINVPHWEAEGGVAACLITEESINEAVYWCNPLVEQDKMKYSKAMRIGLNNYMHKVDWGELPDWMRVSHKSTISFNVTPLDPGLSSARAYLHMSDLPLGALSKLTPNDKHRSYFMKFSELLSPSNDGQPSQEALNTPVRAHERLLCGGYFQPIFP